MMQLRLADVRVRSLQLNELCSEMLSKDPGKDLDPEVLLAWSRLQTILACLLGYLHVIGRTNKEELASTCLIPAAMMLIGRDSSKQEIQALRDELVQTQTDLSDRVDMLLKCYDNRS